MSDIVDRLLSGLYMRGKSGWERVELASEIMAEAAHEIQSLRAQVNNLSCELAACKGFRDV